MLTALTTLMAASIAPEGTPGAKLPVEVDDGVLLQSECLGEGACEVPRQVWVDYAALGIAPFVGGEWVVYDYEEVVRNITAAQVQEEGELSVAVRLIVSEVGADRLLMNKYGLMEAVGILYTVDNRLDPLVYDVEGIGRAPIFEGCGPQGSFQSCGGNPDQYNGMATWRALTPSKWYRPGLLQGAADLAVMAWWLQENALIEDITGGATNYVHRCGGAGYGEVTYACDGGTGGRRRDDIAGANPSTGPLVFKAPSTFARGHYDLYVSAVVHYSPRSEAVRDPGAPEDALADLDLAWDGVMEELGELDPEAERDLFRVYGI